MTVTKAALREQIERCVWIAPNRQFNDACAGGTTIGAFRIALDVAAGRADACMATHRLTREQLLSACAFVVDYRPARWNRRWSKIARAWQTWLEDHWNELHRGRDLDAVPLPPEVRV